MKISKIRQIIKEELEVILTNQEVGDLFGEDVQAKLEEGGGFFEDSEQEESAEGEQALPGAIASLEEGEPLPGPHGETIADQIQDLLDAGELSPENHAFYEDFLNKHIEQTKLAIAKRVEGKEPEGPDEEELQRRMSKAVKSSRRMRQRAKEQGITNIDRTPFGRHLAKKAKEG